MESRTEERLLAYRRQRNRVQKLVKAGKRQYEASLADNAKEEPKTFWRYAKSKLKVKEGISNIQKDGRLVTSDQEKASVLSDFFSSVFTVEAEGETPQLQQRKITRQMDDEEVTDDEVRKLLKGLNLSKSPEPDGLHSHVLKKLGGNHSNTAKENLQHQSKSRKNTKLVEEGQHLNKKGSKTEPSN